MEIEFEFDTITPLGLLVLLVCVALAVVVRELLERTDAPRHDAEQRRSTQWMRQYRDQWEWRHGGPRGPGRGAP